MLCLIVAIELGVMPEIIKAVEEMDWMLPTSIQAEAIPLILGGGDVLAVCILHISELCLIRV